MKYVHAIYLAVFLYFFTSFTPVIVMAQLTENEKNDIITLLNNFLKIDDPLFQYATEGEFIVYQSACNIAAIKALQKVFNNSEFKTQSDDYFLSNKIFTYLSESSLSESGKWNLIGEASDVYVLNKAQCYANKGYQVVAVSEGTPHGHMALLLPGKLVPSYSVRKWYPNTFSFFLDKPSKAFVGIGMRSAWSPCAIQNVKIFYRAAAYEHFNPYLTFNSKFPNAVEQHPVNCEQSNILPSNYKEIKRETATVKVTGIIKDSGSTDNEVKLRLSGYIITNHDETITKVDWSNHCDNNGARYYGTTYNWTDKDKNIHCWWADNITICNGKNKINISAKTCSNGNLRSSGKNITVEHYPASFPTEVLELGNNRQVASTSTPSCNHPYGITIDGIARTDNGKRILSGWYRFDYSSPIKASYYSFNKIDYEANKLTISEKGTECVRWKTEVIDVTGQHGIFVTFIHDGKVTREFFSLAPEPETPQLDVPKDFKQAPLIAPRFETE